MMFKNSGKLILKEEVTEAEDVDPLVDDGVCCCPYDAVVDEEEEEEEEKEKEEEEDDDDKDEEDEEDEDEEDEEDEPLSGADPSYRRE
jgi:hypothetical protein